MYNVRIIFFVYVYCAYMLYVILAALGHVFQLSLSFSQFFLAYICPTRVHSRVKSKILDVTRNRRRETERTTNPTRSQADVKWKLPASTSSSSGKTAQPSLTGLQHESYELCV